VRGLGNREAENELAEKYGYYEVSSLEVTDFHTQFIDLPGGLFRNAFGADEARLAELKARGIAKVSGLDVRVRCTTRSPEYVGMAKYDFYVRHDQPGGAETLLFAGNFFKAAFGLWLRLALAIGLAVVLSTYLSGVISALVTGLLFLGGACKDFIRSVGLGNNVGGGPLEAMVRLARRELTGPTPDASGTTADRIVAASDESFRWVVRRILDVIPEIDRFDLTNYVAEGFNIGGTQLLMSFLLLLVYMLPWAVLAYYLIKWREVASSN
jgi:hypothetical protein